MANHAEELGRILLEHRGSLTVEVCKKAVDDAAAKIEKDLALTGVKGLIHNLQVFLMRNHSEPEACLTEIRRVLLTASDLMRKPSGNAKIPAKANGDSPKGP
jgi:hypothetical protein